MLYKLYLHYKTKMSTAIDFAYTTMGNLYKATALKVKLFNGRAIENEYNRCISEYAIKMLDKRGVNLIQLVMPLHTNYKGKNSVRVMCFLKMKGIRTEDEPERVCLDISHEDWKNFCEKNDPLEY